MNLVQTLRNRPQTSSGFGVMSGPSGYGKSVASTFAVNKLDCIYVEVREFWTRKVFCTSLLREMAGSPRARSPP